MYYFIFLFCFCFGLHSPKNLVVIKDSTLTDIDFYEKISKDDWDSFDKSKKEDVFNDFLKNELSYYDAISVGLDKDPKVFSILKNRKKQVLLNNTYEHLIARPLIDPEVVEKNIKNLKNKVEAYHLLIGYKGSKQDTESTISKESAKSLVDSLYSIMTLESEKENIEDVFKKYATGYSIDPSVQNNFGFLGWVPWGRTVMSFQEPLFKLKNLVLSKPIHTEYGYHLILKKTSALSSHYYYSKENYTDLSKKLALGSLSFDSLRALSSEFDSLTIKESGLLFNKQETDSLFNYILDKKKKDKLTGNKNQLIDWLKNYDKKILFFSKNKKAYGVGWLVDKLSNTQSSRIPPIKEVKDFKDLVLFYVLQEEVVKIGLDNGIENSYSFKKDWLNNKRNILFSEYLSYCLNSITPVDSLIIKKEFLKQGFDKKVFKPKRVVFSEIRVFNESVAKELIKKISNGESFDSLLVFYGGSIKEPLSETKNTPLSRALFNNPKGFVSNIILNNDGSFSVARIERYLKEEKFTLKNMYNKLEREYISAAQDSIKTSLLPALKNKLNPTVYKDVLGL